MLPNGVTPKQVKGGEQMQVDGVKVVFVDKETGTPKYDLNSLPLDKLQSFKDELWDSLLDLPEGRREPGSGAG